MDAIWFMILVPGIPLAAFLGWISWFVRQRERQSRRPFHEMPRPAGWSLQSRMSDLMGDFMIRYMMATLAGMLFSALAISEKANPWVMVGVGFLACTFFLVDSGRRLIRYANCRAGLLGEQMVGRILDPLTSDEVRVFHDIEVREPGRSPWNIDHVVVTTAGVFAIETKTRRKPRNTPESAQKGHQVVFDGKQLIFPEPMRPDRKGLEQAERNATWLAGKLSELNGEPVPVFPVLVFPGWWVDARGKGTVAVLNAKQLPGFLKGRAPLIHPNRFRAISAQLEERCRIDLSLPA